MRASGNPRLNSATAVILSPASLAVFWPRSALMWVNRSPQQDHACNWADGRSQADMRSGIVLSGRPVAGKLILALDVLRGELEL